MKLGHFLLLETASRGSLVPTQANKAQLEVCFQTLRSSAFLAAALTRTCAHRIELLLTRNHASRSQCVPVTRAAN